MEGYSKRMESSGCCLTSLEKLASDLSLPHMRQPARALPAARADPVPALAPPLTTVKLCRSASCGHIYDDYLAIEFGGSQAGQGKVT